MASGPHSKAGGLRLAVAKADRFVVGNQGPEALFVEAQVLSDTWRTQAQMLPPGATEAAFQEAHTFRFRSHEADDVLIQLRRRLLTGPSHCVGRPVKVPLRKLPLELASALALDTGAGTIHVELTPQLDETLSPKRPQIPISGRFPVHRARTDTLDIAVPYCDPGRSLAGSSGSSPAPRSQGGSPHAADCGAGFGQLRRTSDHGASGSNLAPASGGSPARSSARLGAHSEPHGHSPSARPSGIVRPPCSPHSRPNGANSGPCSLPVSGTPSPAAPRPFHGSASADDLQGSPPPQRGSPHRPHTGSRHLPNALDSPGLATGRAAGMLSSSSAVSLTSFGSTHDLPDLQEETAKASLSRTGSADPQSFPEPPPPPPAPFRPPTPEEPLLPPEPPPFQYAEGQEFRGDALIVQTLGPDGIVQKFPTDRGVAKLVWRDVESWLTGGVMFKQHTWATHYKVKVPPENPEMLVSLFRGVSPETLAVWLKVMRDLAVEPHRTLIRTVGYATDGDHLAVVQAFYGGQTLHNLLEEERFSWKLRLLVARVISEGLVRLHDTNDPPLVHGMINAKSIIMSSAMNAKIAHVGYFLLVRTEKVWGQLSKAVDLKGAGLIFLQLLMGTTDTACHGVPLEEVPLAQAPNPHHWPDKVYAKLHGLAVLCLTAAHNVTAEDLVRTMQDLVFLSGTTPKDCMVCMDACRAVRLPCGHCTTCEGCAQDMLRTGAQCPLCRAAFLHWDVCDGSQTFMPVH
eukprot:EG_transcript_3667